MGSVAEQPILIVDDEVENLDLLERCLRRKCGPIHRAEDGEEGLSILNKYPVNMVLTDQCMPKLPGTELLRAAKELQPEAVRVLITGYGDIDTLTNAINAGEAFHFLSKPIDPRILEVVVDRGLETYQARMRERDLFESFVLASVYAIEQRDPTTAGHSFRVAKMTTGLAMVVDALSQGPLAGVSFSRDDLEQIKFASLLHDFGKIGVREAVLVKSHKLPPSRHDLLMYRFGQAVASGLVPTKEVDGYRRLIGLLNDPDTSADEHSSEIEALARTAFVDDEDIEFLRIESGSLSASERAQIEEHVTGTVRFLQQLPWPERLGRVVEIAGAHHERLDGSGYPAGARTMPIESQIMAIADIFDALVASDRPYKAAVSRQHSLDILVALAAQGQVNQQLVDCFIERKVYRAARQK